MIIFTLTFFKIKSICARISSPAGNLICLQMFWQSALSNVTLASSYLMVNCVAELFSLNLIYYLVLHNKSPYRWTYGVCLEGGPNFTLFPQSQFHDFMGGDRDLNCQNLDKLWVHWCQRLHKSINYEPCRCYSLVFNFHVLNYNNK